MYIVDEIEDDQGIVWMLFNISHEEFRWVSMDPNEIGEPAKCTDKGYLLEVDVAYTDQ